MFKANIVAAFEVGDGARRLYQAVLAARTEVDARFDVPDKGFTLGIQAAKPAELAGIK